MSSNFYYLASSLPDIIFDERKDYRELAYLFDEVSESLSDEDQLALRYVRYPADNANLVTLLEEKENAEELFLTGGNYTLKELKHEISVLDSLPMYMVRFLENYNWSQTPFDGTNLIDQLNGQFYKEIIGLNNLRINHFIKRWYVFERDFKNVLTAIECFKHNEPIERRDSARVAQKKGQRLSGDYEVTEALRQSKSYDYSLSGTLPWMQKVLNLNSENIHKYEKDLILIQLESLDDLAGEEVFSLNTILAYFIRLRILIRWSSLDEIKGKKFFENLSGRILENVKMVNAI